jgi:hypothetical protein
VTTLLKHAGHAVKALTTRAPRDDSDGTSLDQQKKAFNESTSQYFSLLSSIDVRLRRQIYALEEAGIISGDFGPTHRQVDVANLPVPGMQAPRDRQAGGLGGLDVGWLNGRNDNVGKEMEAELWQQARSLISELEEEKNQKTGKMSAGDIEMEEPDASVQEPGETDI